MKVEVKKPVIGLENITLEEFCQKKGYESILTESVESCKVKVDYFKLTTPSDSEEIPDEVLELINIGEISVEDMEEGWEWTAADTKDNDNILVLIVEVTAPPYTPIRVMPDMFTVIEAGIKDWLNEFLEVKTETEADALVEEYRPKEGDNIIRMS